MPRHDLTLVKRLMKRPHKVSKLPQTLNVHVYLHKCNKRRPLQDDVRLCLGDDLKKAQDHSQRQAGDLP
ncbi:hypothetical protein Tco_1578738 [Tanacetum coccineum]